MEITGKIKNDTVYVTLKGNLDSNSADIAERHFLEYAESSVNFIVDFKDVEMITSAGIRSLLTLYRFVSEKGGSVSVINTNEQVASVLRLTAFASLFNID